MEIMNFIYEAIIKPLIKSQIKLYFFLLIILGLHQFLLLMKII